MLMKRGENKINGIDLPFITCRLEEESFKTWDLGKETVKKGLDWWQA